MQRLSLAILTGLAFGLAGASSAQAQYGGVGRYGPYSRPPALSPYLNLLNGGNAALNYYLQVQPAFERRAFAQQTEATLLDLERRTSATTNEVENLFPTLSETGHPVGFMQFSPYFNNSGTGGVGRPGNRQRR
ncbi:MAG: hypothetical protein JNM56_17360 [Planctomycetia bacterium]|nr:hypothetical protein [Planctomycetia bacterium]